MIPSRTRDLILSNVVLCFFISFPCLLGVLDLLLDKSTLNLDGELLISLLRTLELFRSKLYLDFGEFSSWLNLECGVLRSTLYLELGVPNSRLRRELRSILNRLAGILNSELKREFSEELEVRELAILVSVFLSFLPKRKAELE